MGAIQERRRVIKGTHLQLEKGYEAAAQLVLSKTIKRKDPLATSVSKILYFVYVNWGDSRAMKNILRN